MPNDDKPITLADVQRAKSEKDQKTAEAMRARYQMLHDSQGKEVADRDLRDRVDKVLLAEGIIPREAELIAKSKRALAEALRKPGRLA